LTTIDYPAEARHDGQLHSFTVETLRIPVCRSCGNKVFTEDVDQQINDKLRVHLGLLSPTQIRQGLQGLGMSPSELADRMGTGEATVSDWLNETQIQSRSMDKLLRLFFAFPQVRAALGGEWLGPELGAPNAIGVVG